MSISFEEQVRERAYQIWLAAGMTEGTAHDHWVRAEQAVTNESLTTRQRAEAGALATTRPSRAKKIVAGRTAAKMSRTKAAEAAGAPH